MSSEQGHKGIFVTGASGYVGRRLLDRRSEFGGTPLFALQRSGSAAGAETVRGDLSSPESYRTALAQSDVVIHLAAATGKMTKDAYFETNVEGTRRLLEASKAAGVRKFIHVSTIAVKFRDTARYYYAQSKQAAEKIVRESGLDYTILRPTLILGPNAPGLAGLTKLALAPMVPVFGGGTARLQPVHVDDVVRAVIDAAKKPEGGDVIEVGGPEILTMKELLKRTRASAGGSGAPLVDIPMAPVAMLLGLLEPVLLSVLPLTAGQLTSFDNDGVADASPWFESRRGQMKGLDEMLRGPR